MIKQFSLLILTLEAWSLWALRFACPRFVSLESIHFPVSFWYIVAITWVAFVALNEVRQLKEKMSLFSSSSSRSQSKNLVEFRAGKMTMRGNMVHPDKRKGLVYIHQSSDSLIHFCWKDRQSGSVEDVCLNICSFVHILIFGFVFRIGSFSLMIVSMFEYLSVPLEGFFSWNSSLPIRKLSFGCR